MMLAKPAAAVGLARRWTGCSMTLAPSPPPNRPRKAVEELEDFDYIFFALAGLPPLAAFVSFPSLAWLTEQILELFRLARQWTAAGSQSDLPLPTANGIVLNLDRSRNPFMVSTINVLAVARPSGRFKQRGAASYGSSDAAIFGCFGTYQHAGNRRCSNCCCASTRCG